MFVPRSGGGRGGEGEVRVEAEEEGDGGEKGVVGMGLGWELVWMAMVGRGEGEEAGGKVKRRRKWVGDWWEETGEVVLMRISSRVMVFGLFSFSSFFSFSFSPFLFSCSPDTPTNNFPFSTTITRIKRGGRDREKRREGGEEIL